MQVNEAAARAAFDAYVAPYDADNARIRLKVQHTYRVAELARRIAASAGMPHPDVELVWLLGLLHDVGRFEQVRRWDTFSDGASVSHAALGVRVLFGEGAHPELADAGNEGRIGILRDFVADASEDALIRTAVETHSDFRLPQGLDARTRALCDVLRDADKVDILRAVSEEPMEAIFGVTGAQMRASRISEAPARAFAERRCVRRDERSQPADVLVGFACFAFELVYPESRRAMLEQGYLFALLDQPFDDPATAAQAREMASEVRTWLEGREN